MHTVHISKKCVQVIHNMNGTTKHQRSLEQTTTIVMIQMQQLILMQQCFQGPRRSGGGRTPRS